MIDLIIYAFACAIIGFVYSDVLTEPNMLLHGFYKWLEIAIKKEWLFKPVIGCFRCVTGQLAFWSYFVLFPAYRIGEFITLHSAKLLIQNIFFHAFYISLSIYLSWMLSKIYRVNL